ncbi:MAG TPA: hypothetical protein PK544_06920 [Spirochaetota bacterium]|nr:hypothetical protein [Spirochaetota bacterium]HPJ39123.1 hypothetical protein [Spirochaetota bacterium]HPQ54066.1 hypothetical protein [Spirochaetota bacterium]
MLKLVVSAAHAEKGDAESKDASWKKEYDARLCSPEEAASVIQTGSYTHKGRPA